MSVWVSLVYRRFPIDTQHTDNSISSSQRRFNTSNTRTRLNASPYEKCSTICSIHHVTTINHPNSRSLSFSLIFVLRGSFFVELSPILEKVFEKKKLLLLKQMSFFYPSLQLIAGSESLCLISAALRSSLFSQNTWSYCMNVRQPTHSATNLPLLNTYTWGLIFQCPGHTFNLEGKCTISDKMKHTYIY